MGDSSMRLARSGERDGAGRERDPRSEARSQGASLDMVPSLAGDSELVQLLTDIQRTEEKSPIPGVSPGKVHSLATQGCSGSGSPLPFLGKISSSFGRHDVSHVRAFTGEAARAATKAMSARAYAKGDSVVFGRTPDLRTAAHEAAHVIQQQGGVQLKGGVGAAGDVHERHADQVADAVVAGRSAERLLDRYTGRGGPARSSGVQMWGEPDHYMMGQLAGRKVVRALDDVETDKERTYKLGEEEKDLSEERDYEQDVGKTVKRVVVPKTEKLFIRGAKGDAMSLGAANRFAGDFTKKPIEVEKGHYALDEMPEQIKKHYIKDRKQQEHVRATTGRFDADRVKIHKEYLDTGHYAEKTLMATNANHFFPLSTIEYRRQHAKAQQKVWMATELWRMAEAEPLDELGESEKAKGLKRQAQELFRQSVMIEGFAGHFLADCFAAGHLAPHALGRIGDKSPVTAGARVNTWHDLFNALPDGIPTSLGSFHGDYSMDGNDLEYVSSVIANSLLEVMMPWYAGVPFNGNVVTPTPDVGAIRADPVAGPLWRTMCGDYDSMFKSLSKKDSRRKTKMSLSKYIIYATSAGSGISKDEVMPAIAAHVYGGDGGLDRTEMELDDAGIRGRIHAIVAALDQVLDWRSGIQEATRLTQKYTPSHRHRHTPKYLMSLRSRQLAKASPTTNPRVSLVTELTHWMDTWKQVLKVSGTKPELAIFDKLILLRPLSGTIKDKERPKWTGKIREILTDFHGLDSTYGLPSPIPAPKPLVEQGPDVGSSPESSSGGAIRAKETLVGYLSEDFGRMDRFLGGCDAFFADPRPTSDDEHRLLYDLLKASAQALSAQVMAKYRETVLTDGDLQIFTAAKVLASVATKLERLKLQGLKLGPKTRKETFRRDAIKSLRKELSLYFTMPAADLMRTTGRMIT